MNYRSVILYTLRNMFLKVESNISTFSRSDLTSIQEFSVIQIFFFVKSILENLEILKVPNSNFSGSEFVELQICMSIKNSEPLNMRER